MYTNISGLKFTEAEICRCEDGTQNLKCCRPNHQEFVTVEPTKEKVKVTKL